MEEVQITSLTVLALSVKDIMKFMGMTKWEVDRFAASSRAKLGAKTSPALAYKAQDFGFTRSGLFNGKPVFELHLQKKLLLLGPWIKFENPSAR